MHPLDLPGWIQAGTGCITAVVAIAGTWFAGTQLSAARHQRKLALGLQYLERYWKISDDLLRTQGNPDEKSMHEYRYLTLCEDEFDAALEGWLDEDMWARWHQWMTTADSRHSVSLLLAASSAPLATADTAAPFDNIHRCLEGSEGHGWDSCPARVVGGVTVDSAA